MPIISGILRIKTCQMLQLWCSQPLMETACQRGWKREKPIMFRLQGILNLIWKTARITKNHFAVGIVKERLKLRNNINFYLTPKGLSYTQLRSMTTLRSKKYQDMTSAQLLLLRDRILFSLEQEVKKHISQWELKQKEILEVA